MHVGLRSYELMMRVKYRKYRSLTSNSSFCRVSTERTINKKNKD